MRYLTLCASLALWAPSVCADSPPAATAGAAPVAGHRAVGCGPDAGRVLSWDPPLARDGAAAPLRPGTLDRGGPLRRARRMGTSAYG